jgi:hypothetical protein
MRLGHSKGPNRVGVSLLSIKDGNSRNIVFSSYLEFQAMDKVTNPVILSDDL